MFYLAYHLRSNILYFTSTRNNSDTWWRLSSENALSPSVSIAHLQISPGTPLHIQDRKLYGWPIPSSLIPFNFHSCFPFIIRFYLEKKNVMVPQMPISPFSQLPKFSTTNLYLLIWISLKCYQALNAALRLNIILSGTIQYFNETQWVKIRMHLGNLYWVTNQIKILGKVIEGEKNEDAPPCQRWFANLKARRWKL